MIPAWLATFAARIGLTGLAIAILFALLAVQTVRIEGFRIWPLSIEGARPKAERLERDLDNVKAAQVVARERAEAAKLKVEQEYRQLAGRIDDEAEEARAGALDDAERFIAANRVRCQATGGSSSGTAAAAEDHGAQGRDGPGSTPELVAVTENDIRVCTVNTTRLEAVREWAIGLETQ